MCGDEEEVCVEIRKRWRSCVCGDEAEVEEEEGKKRIWS